MLCRGLRPMICSSPQLVLLNYMKNSDLGSFHAGKGIQDTISARLAGYPEKAQADMHHARCLVPAAVAHVLSLEPQLVAPAVEAFYNRTPADMRAANRAKHLPPLVSAGLLSANNRLHGLTCVIQGHSICLALNGPHAQSYTRIACDARTKKCSGNDDCAVFSLRLLTIIA